MSEFRLATVEEFEAATARLLETAAKVGADTWQARVKNQTPHCKFGEEGICCRICTMGPCRITKKAPRGICGCDVHGIVGRNYLKFTAGGAATHSDHGREICQDVYKRQVSMTGFLITCVSPLPTLALMKDMNPKGKLWNVAFMVSGASAIGAHLAFVNSVDPEMTGALLGSKLLGGLLTVGLACLIGKIDDNARRKEYGHSYQDSESRRL